MDTGLILRGGDQPLAILLVEDDADDATLIRRHLARSAAFRIEHVDRLTGAFERARAGRFDVVLLDLKLPDSPGGVETYATLQRAIPGVPVIVLSGTEDEELAARAVRMGAQDYLLKGEVTAGLLRRSIRHALERHRLQEEIRALSLTDELTGLRNRRGFVTFAAEELKQARRRGESVSVLFADLDGLKRVNDELGHEEGDRLIRDLAAILRRTFRETDVVARLGGDEFAVLVVHEPGAAGEDLAARLERVVGQECAAIGRVPPISVSVGVDTAAPDERGLESLLERADARMYERKRAKRGR